MEKIATISALCISTIVLFFVWILSLFLFISVFVENVSVFMALTFSTFYVFSCFIFNKCLNLLKINLELRV
jgi:hypothetical protein